MNCAPFAAQGGDVRPQIGFDAPHVLRREPVGFPQFWRAIRAIQYEHRLAALPPDMDMRGAMVSGIDHHAQSVEAQDGRTVPSYQKPKRLGI